ncbi:MAG: sigma-70 family RNA polymerase sigma factor [Candidatus Caldatribacteriota bacterium]|jgi:RNA polymerase sigma factor (sigma-70 family)|nr:sigma-70 family RNA polymerase sigma factor [Atribacterota bacterium]MDD3640960.1 sigma-70 family RNA polymerase sigma factor [Atribacterota bacterium]MDD4288673.1 sigma-70 family RNA polymerase sigma factor [Atribacterota bacterium]MDD4765845.1 sigma-70 family RNA polymerase sigma factor [Atribacterota bacterium]MDI9596808.1 sigma-70 family RNA polymerase sigma factor [Atribacterota bacterium]
MGNRGKRELDEIINRLRYQLKAIIRKLNLHHQYIDGEDLYQEILLYLWQQNRDGKLKNKNDSYILQGCYYYLKNYLRKYVRSESKKSDYNQYYNLPKQGNESGKDNQFDYHNHTTYDMDEYLYYDDFKKELSYKERALLNLKLKGLSSREIGKELGISHTMVLKMRKKMVEKYKSLYQ